MTVPSIDTIIEHLNSVNYYDRVQYAAELAKENKESGKLKDHLILIFNSPDYTFSNHYHLYHFAIIAASVLEYGDLLKSFLQRCHPKLYPLIVMNVVKMESDDNTLFDLYVPSCNAVRKLFLSSCIRIARYGVVDKIFEFTRQTSLEKALSFIHGCSKEVIRNFDNLLQYVSEVNWKSIASNNADLLLEMLEDQLKRTRDLWKSELLVLIIGFPKLRKRVLKLLHSYPPDGVKSIDGLVTNLGRSLKYCFEETMDLLKLLLEKGFIAKVQLMDVLIKANTENPLPYKQLKTILQFAIEYKLAENNEKIPLSMSSKKSMNCNELLSLLKEFGEIFSIVSCGNFFNWINNSYHLKNRNQVILHVLESNSDWPLEHIWVQYNLLHKTEDNLPFLNVVLDRTIKSSSFSYYAVDFISKVTTFFEGTGTPRESFRDLFTRIVNEVSNGDQLVNLLIHICALYPEIAPIAIKRLSKEDDIIRFMKGFDYKTVEQILPHVSISKFSTLGKEAMAQFCDIKKLRADLEKETNKNNKETRTRKLEYLITATCLSKDPQEMLLTLNFLKKKVSPDHSEGALAVVNHLLTFDLIYAFASDISESVINAFIDLLEKLKFLSEIQSCLLYDFPFNKIGEFIYNSDNQALNILLFKLYDQVRTIASYPERRPIIVSYYSGDVDDQKITRCIESRLESLRKNNVLGEHPEITDMQALEFEIINCKSTLPIVQDLIARFVEFFKDRSIMSNEFSDFEKACIDHVGGLTYYLDEKSPSKHSVSIVEVFFLQDTTQKYNRLIKKWLRLTLSTIKTKKEKISTLLAFSQKLVALDKSALFIKFVWRYLYLYDQKTLETYLDLETINETRFKTSKDYFDTWTLPASYKLLRLTPNQSKLVSEQWIGQFDASALIRRQKAYIHLGILPSTTVDDLAKLLEDYPDYEKFIFLALSKTLHVDDLLNFLLDEEQLSHPTETRGKQCIYTITPLLPYLHDKASLISKLSDIINDPKYVTCISMQKEIVRLLASNFSETRETIGKLVNRKGLHRDISITLVRSLSSQVLDLTYGTEVIDLLDKLVTKYANNVEIALAVLSFGEKYTPTWDILDESIQMPSPYKISPQLIPIYCRRWVPKFMNHEDKNVVFYALQKIEQYSDNIHEVDLEKDIEKLMYDILYESDVTGTKLLLERFEFLSSLFCDSMKDNSSMSTMIQKIQDQIEADQNYRNKLFHTDLMKRLVRGATEKSTKRLEMISIFEQKLGEAFYEEIVRARFKCLNRDTTKEDICAVFDKYMNFIVALTDGVSFAENYVSCMISPLEDDIKSAFVDHVISLLDVVPKNHFLKLYAIICNLLKVTKSLETCPEKSTRFLARISEVPKELEQLSITVLNEFFHSLSTMDFKNQDFIKAWNHHLLNASDLSKAECLSLPSFASLMTMSYDSAFSLLCLSLGLCGKNILSSGDLKSIFTRLNYKYIDDKDAHTIELARKLTELPISPPPKPEPYIILLDSFARESYYSYIGTANAFTSASLDTLFGIFNWGVALLSKGYEYKFYSQVRAAILLKLSQEYNEQQVIEIIEGKYENTFHPYMPSDLKEGLILKRAHIKLAKVLLKFAFGDITQLVKYPHG